MMMYLDRLPENVDVDVEPILYEVSADLNNDIWYWPGTFVACHYAAIRNALITYTKTKEPIGTLVPTIPSAL